MSLQADIANLADGNKVGTKFTVRGWGYNAAGEGAFTDGGLQAFYRYPSARDWAGNARPFPDTPPSDELPFGTNSEFAANAAGSGNWWIQNTAAFRATYGLPGDAGVNDQWFPPWILRKIFGVVTNASDDNGGWGDNFTVRMEGRLAVPTNQTYTFGGGGDDRMIVYVDGRLVYHSSWWWRYNGQYFLTAGEHGFTADFGEDGGGQYYGFNIPAGCTLKANAQNEHTFSGWTLEYGRYYQEQRPDMLTLAFRNGVDGSGGWIGTTNYFKGASSESYGNDSGPAPQADSYRMLMVGYWNVPSAGVYEFTGGADDRWAIAVTNDAGADPWTIPQLAPDNTGCSVTLTAGWKPFRMEFGEGGGGASWTIQWSNNGGVTRNYFYPADFMSTADKAYDWTFVTNSPTPCPAETNLCAVDVGAVAEGTLVDVRLRAVGTDMSNVEKTVQVQISLGGEPDVRNTAPSNLTATTAFFNGYLSSTGKADTTVLLCWGTNDGATATGNWQHVNDFGLRDIGPLTTNVALETGAVNFYRYLATNAYGALWATNVGLVIPGYVTIAATDPSAAEMPPNPASFTVTRPSWSTGVAVQVTYGVAGTAVNGVDYNSLSGVLTLPAGSAAADITVLPVADTNGAEGTETVILTLLPSGQYLSGSPSSSTGTITDFTYVPMSLRADIANLHTGDKVPPRFTVSGWAYNATPEQPFVPGGLQAFYRIYGGTSSNDYLPTARAVPDVPALGELPFGTNSEFATNPANYANWWVQNTAAFRTTYGLPGDAGVNDQWFPPWIMRRVFSQTNSAADDAPGLGDSFGVRMEGRLVVTNDQTYTFTGGGDDAVLLYLNGRTVYCSRYPGQYNGQVALATGEYPFTVDFIDFGGGQNYSFTIPPGAALKANAPFLHNFAGWTLELGRWYQGKKRPGCLTAAFRNGWDGSGAFLGVTNYFKGASQADFGNDMSGCPQTDNYRMYMAGYWYVPTNGAYDFNGGADDRWTVTISDNTNSNPWTIPVLASDNTPINGIALTQGWRPFRMEFGDMGGGANFSISWRVDAGGWSLFYPGSFMSTADRAYDWTLLTNSPTPLTNNAFMAPVYVPEAQGLEPVALRLRAIGSDLSFVERRITVTVKAGWGTMFIVE